MIEVDLLKRNKMFLNAWRETVGIKSGISIEESNQLWLEHFGCKMISKGGVFVTAVFEREADYTAFLLRWA